MSKRLTTSQSIIYQLSERIVAAQRPIRVLDAIKWEHSIYELFIRHNCKKNPIVTRDYYQSLPLSFDLDEKRSEFYGIERDIKRQLGQFSGIGTIMLRMCREYRLVVDLIENRGKKSFGEISKELYGSSLDAFYAGGPLLIDLADILSSTISNIGSLVDNEADVKKYPADEAVQILQKNLKAYFHDAVKEVKVILSDGIISDAAAGAEVLKLKKGVNFSQRELRILEVHEGWVHIGTTLNGLSQPICTFLSKGPPSSTIYQEGLAVIMEIFTFASHPDRMQRLINRIKIINMAENGADFLEVFNYLRDQELSIDESYVHASRVFRGSLADLPPFTKDLSYSKGFILIYNYIRLAIQEGLLKRIPLLFLGKTTLEDLAIYESLVEEGTVILPKYIPPHFSDLAGLSSWMCYSLFLNKLSLDKLTANYKTIL